jgi:hypothetical protein
MVYKGVEYNLGVIGPGRRIQIRIGRELRNRPTENSSNSGFSGSSNSLRITSKYEQY